ncbi:hypothetical protein M501DRAFT_1020757 [Patellaria atrata CBS 101060]|uniref:Transcription factor SipA3 n=1 Tax=Patellaria atrata CBS 101060 TaxID=1346257 RepID=A0A9P4S184_9PEZI|nr:hypothetical protein M501DRAFT_1020757 [Patellaria atrata CBS 101060]
MDDPKSQQPSLTPVDRPLSLIPVGLKEAALDSPTFRATAIHFSEQVDIIEKWLENYIKAASKLATEVNGLETLVNSFLSQSTPPQQISEAVLDHDYTLLATKRFGEGAREFWSYTFRGMRRVETSVVDPIKAFLMNDLRALRETRKTLEQSQKYYDGVVARFSGQPKTKEASSLREDAFQLHEARKSYLKASMDFTVMAPQVRATLDKLLVKIFADQWKDLKSARESTSASFSKASTEMERVRGWCKEMEEGERTFKRELHLARKQIEESAESIVRPSRELDDYAASTVPYIGSGAQSTPNLNTPAKTQTEKSEKQGWLFQRTITGKPARTVWVRRWFFVKNGIFGWLVHGLRSGAVEESEKIGVLLCSIRPAFQEERRFCFEVKTKDTTILLQAEIQSELMEWISAFEVAKRKALEDPGSTDATLTGTSVDPAFAITQPVAPEFAARTADGHAPHGSDEVHAIERAGTLSVTDREGLGSLAARTSFDVTNRRATIEREGESTREHAARIIQKLDLHRKSTAGPQLTAHASTPSNSGGGIASLISASHNILPVGPAVPPPTINIDNDKLAPAMNLPTSTLAPSTLANPPAATNLSKTAVVVSGERGVGLGQGNGGVPSGIMANLWGSTHWGSVNRIERGELRFIHERSISQPPSPASLPIESTGDVPVEGDVGPPEKQVKNTATPTHRKTMSLGTHPSKAQRPTIVTDDFPNYYPLPLRAQDAQFRMLFPEVTREEKLLLVFRATWNPNDQQEFPGRVYVTASKIFFYSNHLGLVLITGIRLSDIEEVTAAPGKDCDFLFLHFDEEHKKNVSTRVTIKTFLEPLKLLQRRLNYLVRNSRSSTPRSIEDILKALIKMEADENADSPSMESWEDVSVNTPIDGNERRGGQDLKASLRIDGNLFDTPAHIVSRNATKFRLPAHPVVYAPEGMTSVVVDKDLDVSAKALFHILFGDKSAVFHTLYCEQGAQRFVQGPWVQPEKGHHRREFQYQNYLGQDVVDYQMIDVYNDHLCYVVTDRKYPWYLPSASDFSLVSKIVITHIAKSRCKLAIYVRVDWIKEGPILKGLIEREAAYDLQLQGKDIAEMITDQVVRLGSNSRTRKAIQIFGQVGVQGHVAEVAASDIPSSKGNKHFKMESRSLASLLISESLSIAGSGISSIVSLIVTVVTSVSKVTTAHSILVGLLIFSTSFNLFTSTRDSLDWWHERNAANFMSRMGVKPNTIMSKAIYIHDIDEILTNATASSDLESLDQTQCRTSFRELYVYTSPGLTNITHFPFADIGAKYTAKRLQRTREHLAAYRHNLLVAMRMVNAIEKETLQAEWENWLVAENVRCRQMGRALGWDSQGEIRAGGESLEKVEEWYNTYCAGCRRELEQLEQ